MKKQTLARLLTYAKPYFGFFIASLLCAVLSVGLTLVGPVLVGRAIDFILGPGEVDFRGVLSTLSLFLVTLLLSGVFQWLMGLFNNAITFKTTRDLRVASFSKLNTVPLKYIDGHSHGDLISRITNDVNQVGDGLLQGLTQLFTGIVTILGTLILMLTIHPLITLVVVLLTPLSIFVASFIVRHTSKHFAEQTAIQGELSGYVNETVGNKKLVTAFSHEEISEKEFEDMNETLHVVGIKAQFFSSLSNPSTRFVNALVYAAVGIIGALSAIQGNLTVGQISCFLSYANQYTKPFNEVTSIIDQLQTAFASADRVFQLLDAEDEPADLPGAKEFSHCSGQITFDHVCFSYSPKVSLIEDFCLEVHPGQNVAIVGPTGCGKTTLVNLLMRFYDVTSGRILVDGIDTKQLTRDSLRAQFGMVLQDTWLANATIRENIAYGRPDASEEEIVAAAQAAQAHSFILRLPQGYDTLVSTSGENLSQGQRQLLSIARVMLMDPPMLILDEATSNIDTRTEIFISDAFQKMMEGRTSFIVAHRLSTIQQADLILVMNQGNIVEQGTHDALLKKGGFYANLYKSQFVKSQEA